MEADSLFAAAREAQQRGDEAAARILFDRVLALDPEHFDARHMLAVIELAAGRPVAARTHLEQCLSVDPDFVPALSNLAIALLRLRRHDEASTLARRALVLRPGFAEAWTALGSALREQERLKDALAAHEHAIRLKPDGVTARYNAGIVRLMQGDLAAGWPGFDLRFQARSDAAIRHRGLPDWRGPDDERTTLLVWPEQGIGDEIVFASCLPDLQPRRGRLLVECDARLVALLQRSIPFASVLPLGAALPEEQVAQIPSGGLARLMRPDLRSFPQRRSFLTADPQRVADWRRKLAMLGPEPKVGVLWRGLEGGLQRDSHYTAIQQWDPVLAVPGVRFIGLQYGDVGGEPVPPAVHFLPGLDLRDDLDNVAALMSALDLVISPGTAGFALAASVGCPTWVLATGDDWMRLGTAHYPWLPTARAFARPAGQGWEGVLSTVADRLRAEIAQPPSSS